MDQIQNFTKFMNPLYFGYLLEPVLKTWQIRAIPFDENPLYVSKSYFFLG